MQGGQPPVGADPPQRAQSHRDGEPQRRGRRQNKIQFQKTRGPPREVE